MVSSREVVRHRAQRVRRQIRAAANGRPRLSVYRSNQNIYAQVIDDARGCTLVSACTLEENLKKSLSSGSDKKAASAVGKLIAERAKKAGISEVIFDRGAYVYHGRVKALAEAAREGGLNF
ncbi:50S ribosomal protein L18 [Bartonella ancashensis]|uniref:Large ribosomal subunit protein uL18 n=1 Tax=Bartonella ancashensis TaxID=1318743 RepID=A0A0M5KSN3_9HYPH|nr:50S ribosomal protein L18 [Bartonella ancashensis]ALE03690.1 LSU ribosomal protein L18p (L5e) [Bartonella ancashensis]